MIRFTYVSTVVKQRYLDGKPLYRSECIGVPHASEAYAEDLDAALSNFCSWQRDAYHAYSFTGYEFVKDVPKGAFVFSRYQQGYRYERKH